MLRKIGKALNLRKEHQSTEGHHEDDQPASDLSPHPSPSSTFRVSNASAATPAPVSASPSPRKKGFLAKTLTKVRDTVGRVRNGTRKTEQDMEEDDHKEAKQDALFATNEVKQITERGPPIAALEVRIIEGRQMDKSSRKPRIAVTVEGKTEHTEVCTGEKPEWHIIRPRKVTEKAPPPPFRFDISDATGDIRVLVCEHKRKIGRIIIPLRWLYIVESKRLQISWQGFDRWFQVLPMPMKGTLKESVAQRLAGVTPNTVAAAEENKFYPALPRERGTGLPDPETPLGHLRIKIDVHPYSSGGPHKNLILSYLHAPRSGAAVVTWRDINKDAKDYVAEENNDKVLNFEGVLRLVSRIKMLIKGPPLVMRPPYSIATMVWLYLACFWTSAPQVPWMMLALMGIEGASLFIRRDLSETLIWESEVQKKEKKGILELGGVLKKGLRLIGAYQYKLSLIVSALERAKNSISFADTLGSVMLYAALAFLCLVASILISMMPVGLPWFLVGAGALLPPYVKLYKLYMGHSKICNAEKRKNPDFFDRFKMYSRHI